MHIIYFIYRIIMPTLLILLLNFFHPGHWESFSWFLFPFDIPHLFAYCHNTIGGSCCNPPFPFDSLFQWIPYTAKVLSHCLSVFPLHNLREGLCMCLMMGLSPAHWLDPLGTLLEGIPPEH